MKNKTLPSKFPFHCPEFCHIKTTREHKKFNFKLETLLSILNQSNISREVKENVHGVAGGNACQSLPLWLCNILKQTSSQTYNIIPPFYLSYERLGPELEWCFCTSPNSRLLPLSETKSNFKISAII